MHQLTKMRPNATEARWIEEETNVELAKALDKITAIAQLIKARRRLRSARCAWQLAARAHPGEHHVRVLPARIRSTGERARGRQAHTESCYAVILTANRRTA